jgi:hypothetical protein
MFDLRHLSRLAALAVATGLIAAACGSSGSSPSATTGTEASVAPSVEAPSAAPASEAPASEAPAASIGALPSFDLSSLGGAIPGLDSYRTSTSSGGKKQYESVVVEQPELSKAITVYDTESGNVTNRYVIIGKDAWTADGPNGAFTAIPGGTDAAGGLLLAYDPAMFLGAFASIPWAQAGTNQGMEDKNGVQAHHLRIDSTSILGAAGGIPAGASIDIWVADAGYLVAWEMAGFESGADFSIQVTNVNDPSNKVEKPS